METKSQDSLVILKLYEIRSEQLMREARRWFFSEFAPQSGKDILALMQSGEKQSAFYRMVASHWEVAAAREVFAVAHDPSDAVSFFSQLCPLAALLQILLHENCAFGQADVTDT